MSSAAQNSPASRPAVPAVNPGWPDNAAIFELADPLIKKWEGLRQVAYLCPADKWTIGYGTTIYPDGSRVKKGDTCSAVQALTYLEFSARRIIDELKTKGALTRVPNVFQAAAFVVLAYNVGLGHHDGVKGDLSDSTLFDRFNAGDDKGAAHCFLDWDKAHIDGVLTVVAGLKDRRADEAALYARTA